jgi:hypothetical protein
MYFIACQQPCGRQNIPSPHHQRGFIEVSVSKVATCVFLSLFRELNLVQSALITLAQLSGLESEILSENAQ